jgi:hypothetical protein
MTPLGTIRTQIMQGQLWTTATSATGGGGLGSLDLGGGQSEVRFTLLGDTDLNGTVNVADLGNLASNFGSTTAVWINGDFDYNNNVNVADLGDLSSNFGNTVSYGSAATANSAATNTAAASATPAAVDAAASPAATSTPVAADSPFSQIPLPIDSSADAVHQWRAVDEIFSDEPPR